MTFVRNLLPLLYYMTMVEKILRTCSFFIQRTLKIVAVSILCLFFLVSSLSTPNDANAFGVLAFGGRVLWVYYCVNGLWVAVGPPRPGLYFYVWGLSGIKLYGPPLHAAQQVLGHYFGAMVCLVPCPTGVCPIGGGLLVGPNSGSSQL